MELTLLVSLLSLLKFSNLDYIDFKEAKLNVELLEKFFFHGTILLTFTKLFLKQTSYIIGYRALKIVK